jgi:hypothetical protein
MALSGPVSGLGIFQRMSFSAAASGGTAPLVTESQEITCITAGFNAVTGHAEQGTEFLTVFCQMSGAAATGTLAIFCIDDDSVGSLGDGKLFWDTAALAAGTLRQSHNTAAGNYIATVAFAQSGKNVIDVRGIRGPNGGFPKWYCALTVISTGTAVVHIIPGRAI